MEDLNPNESETSLISMDSVTESLKALRDRYKNKPEFLLNYNEKEELKKLDEVVEHSLGNLKKYSESELKGYEMKKLNTISSILLGEINELSRKIDLFFHYLPTQQNRINKLEESAKKMNNGEDFRFLTKEFLREEEYDTVGNSWYPWEGGGTSVSTTYRWRIFRANAKTKTAELVFEEENTQKPNSSDIPGCLCLEQKEVTDTDNDGLFSNLSFLLENEWMALQTILERSQEEMGQNQAQIHDYQEQRDFVRKRYSELFNKK